VAVEERGWERTSKKGGKKERGLSSESALASDVLGEDRVACGKGRGVLLHYGGKKGVLSI